MFVSTTRSRVCQNATVFLSGVNPRCPAELDQVVAEAGEERGKTHTLSAEDVLRDRTAANEGSGLIFFRQSPLFAWTKKKKMKTAHSG